LVILTDDGELAAHLLHPSYGIARAYRVAIDTPLEARHRRELLRGICDGGEVLRLSHLDILSRDRRILDIRLGEGRKRQIRRMLSALGYGVIHLERYRVGAFTLEGIRPGKYFTLEEKHLHRLLATEEPVGIRASRRGER
jgi:23S rRNA pseudouridine2605 synthase